MGKVPNFLCRRYSLPPVVVRRVDVIPPSQPLITLSNIHSTWKFEIILILLCKQYSGAQLSYRITIEDVEMIPTTFGREFFEMNSNSIGRWRGLDQPRALRVDRVVPRRVGQPAFGGVEPEKIRTI